ncbi:ferredoxin-type protein NapG [Pseudovibrio ascidiaceicola]|jgi:ferredoxin-type protein NapG|uniref:Quinol dehydrogenase periplasmic component n=2 Tax=Alphaproteobacteria TaxID=28211 RepID=M4HX00_9PROT|nr:MULTISPECIES: ferredoxin-type protein NapG [Pseudovibrio]AFT64025.1 quinol dehydrogenase periplasmic component [alpha proteobacterium D323]KZK80664.1 NAD(P)H-quinone oxidoreductase subunit I, chloroplastic [Pseudovibrio sp. Ad13]KZK89746.1 NAD(P)H-quinone oxidoreductase subunit I, chloroplastic [Pseudovibrio sp. Ad5]KZL03049.1 NAD(P)H-quinone oxidoreductase subunit I, chloroplastic [Pseudovibrio sp. W74]KZL04932.1 NAD(P)H-quinone oxidoreductase subunit I, chloroplastic [Pseudovibrio sp. Ad1
MSDLKKTGLSSAKRRQFLGDAARTACGCAVAATFLTVYQAQAKAFPADAIRPPGALSEEEFLSACVRCGLCVRDCPYDTLKLAELGETGPATGTPYFTARDVPCEMCEDIPCVAACPTGALDHSLTDIDDADMGVAVLIDQENCLNFLGLRCEVCYRVCPLIDEAITLEMTPNTRTGSHAVFSPTVYADVCTGCGKCEQSCVLPEAAIKVLPRRIARAESAEHYRLGWEEKAKAGNALVPGVIDLPDRVPDAGGFEPVFQPGKGRP